MVPECVHLPLRHAREADSGSGIVPKSSRRLCLSSALFGPTPPDFAIEKPLSLSHSVDILL